MPMKKGRGNFRNKGKGRGGGGGNNWSTERKSYAEVPKVNEQFERLYNDMNIVPEGEEREQFWAALRRELPNSFRFCGSKGHALAVQKNLDEHFIPQIKSMKFDDQTVEPPMPITWYPNQLAYYMTTPKNVIRKFPPFAAFQKFLVSETAVGNISRQEAVSMIPPLLLDVQSHHTVLDLCAAPGSKSAQLVEMLHAGEESRIRKATKQHQDAQADPAAAADETVEGNDWSDDGRATGLLVANDVNYQRAQMLVHQVKRLNSPNLIVTNHDATMFPSIELPSDPVPEGQKKQGKWLKFDRILADVPCSGDGTCRKNPNIWKDWIPGNGLGLYITQVRILVRAIQMLKVGGRVVYSTCSMNPVENEAVISSAIERCGGIDKINIVDVSDQLPELKRYPGLKEWKIMDKEGRLWNSWEDVEDAKSKKFEASLERVVPGMFAPAGHNLPLDRCVRVYPHQQDTGGFFITVLEKKSEIRAKPESETKSANSAPSVVSIAKEIVAKPESEGVIPKLETMEEYAPSDPNHTVETGTASAAQRQNKEAIADIDTASNKRGLEDVGDSAAQDVKRARTEKDEGAGPGAVGEVGQMEHWPMPPSAPLRQDEITPDEPAAIAAASAPRGRRNNQPHEEAFKYLSPSHEELDGIFDFYQLSSRFPRDRFMVRNALGNPVKAIYYTTALAKDILTKNEGRGMKFVHSGVKMFVKQDAQGQDICRWRLQSEGLPIVEGWAGENRIIRCYKQQTLRKLLIEMFPRVSGEHWKELGEIGEKARDIGMGCCILRVEPSTQEDGFAERLTLPLWRSISSLNLMLPKEERRAMLLRLFKDESPLIDHSQQPNRKNAPATSDPTVSATAAPETVVDSDGGVALNDTDADMEDADATAPVGASGVGTEEDAMATEDALRAQQQSIADEDQAVAAAPEREGETDEANTTV
ncbi:S-adenosyl-L-methionine-dependent methyltransferase [Aureobasidium sp. EXF-12298]